MRPRQTMIFGRIRAICCSSQALQAACYQLVAHPFAILGQVTGDQHKIGLQLQNIAHERIQNLQTLAQHLSVAV